MGVEAIETVSAQCPELAGNEPAMLGIVLSHGMFHLPLLSWARSRREHGSGGRTWLYQLDRRCPATGTAAHCSDLPFVFDCLAEPHAPVTLGKEASQALAEPMRSDWVRSIVEGDPGQESWRGVSQRGSESE